MKSKKLWIGLLVFSFLAVLAVVLVGISRTRPVVVSSSAQAWMWMAPEMQPQLLNLMQEYAKKEDLTFESRKIPASWNMISITLTTPKGNELEIINATALDTYSVSITVFHDDEDWRPYWGKLRSYLNARYKWKDIP